MDERLGIGLYWICFNFAGLWLLLVLSFWWSNRSYHVVDAGNLVFAFLPALLLWLLGKWLRYMFARK